MLPYVTFTLTWQDSDDARTKAALVVSVRSPGICLAMGGRRGSMLLPLGETLEKPHSLCLFRLIKTSAY